MLKMKPLFIFDIDETLVHTFDSKSGYKNAEKNPLYELYTLDIDDDFYWGYIRPHARELLLLCNKIGRVAFWSAGEEEYVKQVLKVILDPIPKLEPLFVWSRDYCVHMPENKMIKRMLTDGDLKKPIEKVCFHQNVCLESIIIIDDRNDVGSENLANLLWVGAFKPEKSKTNDDELLQVINHLKLHVNKTPQEIASSFHSKSNL